MRNVDPTPPMPERLPLIILAGSDAKHAFLPPGRQAADMLQGHKGTIELAGGQPLVGALIERFRQSGRFQQPIVVGPARIYAQLPLDCEVVNSEGGMSRTLETAVKVLTTRFASDSPVAFSACDILPTAQELSTLMGHAYDPVAGSVCWGQLVSATADQMGASSWKPAYAFSDPAGGTMNLYPGHLVVVRPAALRSLAVW